MTLPLKNMDDQLTHPPTQHPPRNKQSNQQQKTKTAKNKQQQHTQQQQHNNNNNNNQTNKQQQQNNKSQQKRIIRTTTTTTTTTTNPLHVQLIRLYCVLCYMLIVHLFLFCGFLSALVCLFCCCGWDKPNLDWMVKRQAMLVGTRQDKKQPNLRLTIAQSHSLTVNSLQLDDSTVPLWPLPSAVNSLQHDDSTVPLSDRQQPSAWR